MSTVRFAKLFEYPDLGQVLVQRLVVAGEAVIETGFLYNNKRCSLVRPFASEEERDRLFDLINERVAELLVREALESGVVWTMAMAAAGTTLQ